MRDPFTNETGNPTSDACCTRMGWIEYTATAGCSDLHFSVHPETDLDGTFMAFCHDGQEMIRVNGWNLSYLEAL